MTKDLIKYLIAEFQKQVAEVKLYPREYEFEDGLNYVLVGLRRAGKSYLMFQQIQRLLSQGHSINEILYFNFEDDRIEQVEKADLDKIKLCYEEMYNTRPIFFLDEIQLVDGWEKFARRLADTKYQVYITGSNAKMLSGEIATTLGGRYIIKEVYPYSFCETLRVNGVDLSDKNVLYNSRDEIEKIYNNYFYNGGLPEIHNIQDKRAWLSSLFNKVFFGDVITRYQIRNDFGLKVLIRKLAESVKQPSSFTRLASIVTSTGKKITTDTVIDYMAYIQESWLILAFENICAKLSDKESNKKYYFIDNGILNLFLVDPNTSLLENQVAIFLRQKYGSDVYYYKQNVEVDFIAYNAKIAWQVSYTIADPDTREREVEGLKKLAKFMPMKKYYIITKDEEDEIKKDGITIEVVPVWKWMMMEQ